MTNSAETGALTVDPLDAVPTLMLWMNNGCNARCIMCEIWRGDAKMYYTEQEITAWTPAWKRMGVQLIELCGEPTIHPEIRQICDILQAEGFRFTFLSNGLRLEKFADLITARAGSLTVSLDGPPTVHDAVRHVAGAYERLARGVARVRALAPEFPVYGRCVVHRRNFRHLHETVETARTLSLTSISFFGIDIGTPAFGRDDARADGIDSAADLEIQESDLPELAAGIDGLEREHAADLASRFICESPALLRRTLSPRLLASRPGGNCGFDCNVPFKSVVLEPDGSVRPCWFLPAYGNALEEGGVEAVLQKPSSVQFRANLNVAEHPVCMRCITPRVFDSQGKSRSGFKLTA